MSIHSQQSRAARAIRARCPNFQPKIGIILGSGLGGLADHLRDAIEIPYEELPDFGSSTTVAGHEGKLILGYLFDVPVVCLKGRRHFYEGITNPMVQTLVRTLKLLGCEILIATNAAGSLDLNAGPGSLMLITDHINFSFHNALVGHNDDEFGPRFISMNDAYDPQLRGKMLQVAEQLKIPLHQGVYIGVLGPSFETPAEIRAFKMWGASAVGMSTVNEVIVARHCGLRVVVVSAITNLAAGLTEEAPSHEETLLFAEQASGNLIRLIENFVRECADE